MTCVIGYRTEAHGWLAADSRASCPNGDRPFDNANKLVQVGDWMVGTAGSPRLAWLLRDWVARAPAHFDGGIWDLCSQMRKLVKEDDWDLGTNRGGAPESNEVGCIALGPGGLYVIPGSFTPEEVPPDHCVGVGAGADFAVGAFTADSMRLESADAAIVARAVEVAAVCHESVGGPVQVKHFLFGQQASQAGRTA